MSEVKRRVVIDLDVGTDDAHALLTLLYAEKNSELKVEAICCSMGNTSVENVAKNVVRILEIVNRTDIPVYKGCCEPLVPSESFAITNYHGNDGFGDLNLENEPNTSIIKETLSVIAMAQIAEKYPGEITLVCLGPLTNVALAMKLFHNFSKNLKDIYLMGGNYSAVGNVTPTAEYNFYVDPEAAYIVFKKSMCAIFMLTWECCLETHISIDWRWNILGGIKSKIIALLTEAEKTVYKDSKLWIPCDAYLAAVLIYPNEVTERQSKHHATVELHGHKTRAQIVLDHLKLQEPNVTIIEKINEDFFKKLILEVHQHYSQI